VITLFHKPSISASVRAANILKQASAAASETATEDQASDHTPQNKHVTRDPFELEVTEAAPTQDQLKSIFEYVGAGKAAELVKGAASQNDALRKVHEDGDAFKRPVVVDWANARAVVGGDGSEILKLMRESEGK
jgi:arsenate reductase-like glutaredoxin family protein